MKSEKFYAIDLERIKIIEFAVLTYKFFEENNLYSKRTVFVEDIFKAMMGVPPRSAGRLQWWVFKQLFSQARNYLASSKRVTPVFIQGRRVKTFTSVPTSSKKIGKLGYSISHKDTDFLKNNEVLSIMRDIIDSGIYKNQKRADDIKKQKSITDFLKIKWFDNVEVEESEQVS